MKLQSALPHRRSGFTLVELLVAAALSILIMFVISTAFQTGLQTLSTLKSLGDMAERLKTADAMLRADLEADHFTTGTGDDSPGSLRVSDLQYHLTANGSFNLTGSSAAAITVPSSALPSSIPTGGYFQIVQGAASAVEGTDADGLLCSRAGGAGANHRISMTVKRTGKSPDQLFNADLGQLQAADQNSLKLKCISDVSTGTQLVAQWAQVDWFLDTTRPSSVNGITTWPLVRRVRVLAPGTQQLSLTSAASTAADVLSLSPGNLVNTIQSVATPANRTTAAPIANAAKVGDDIVITNVLSFEVRPMYAFPTAPTAVTPGALDGLFADLPAAANGSFDTGVGTTSNGNKIRVLAVQVKIRVYDTKNKLTRQMTSVVKL